MDPYIRQAADDRGYCIALEKQMLAQRQQITTLEDILFDRRDLAGMDLFGKIYSRIKDVDCARLVEEQKLHVRVCDNSRDVKALTNTSEKILQRMD